TLFHLVNVFAAELHYQRNDLEAASALIFTALPEAEHAESWTELYISAYRTAVSLTFLNHGLAAAENLLAAGKNFAEHSAHGRLAFNLACRQATFLVLDGQPAAARAIANAGDFQA